jgi:hypothetical protein
MTDGVFNLIPSVLRARDFRLYAKSQSSKDGRRRLIDLWQNGGAAVLGHTPPNMLRELKNTASRGLYAPFPHFLENRYKKALSQLFPGRSFKLYAAPPQGLELLFNKGDAGLWRPFLDPESPFAVKENAPEILIPVLPGIQGWRGNLPLGLCVLAVKLEKEPACLGAEETLSPVLLAVAARGVYDLIAWPDRGKPVFPHIFQALKKGGGPGGTTRWLRKGIYLHLKEKMEAQKWEALFRQFLDAGFLLPPDPSQPLILPGVLSKGEETKLATLLRA